MMRSGSEDGAAEDVERAGAITVGRRDSGPSGQEQPAAEPVTPRAIYPDVAEGEHDVRDGMVRARAEHKRVLILFGADWCGDCQVLDRYLHDATSAELVANHFVMVPVNVGGKDQNVELARRCGVPLERGVPATSVLAGTGEVVHAQADGEFASLRSMDPRAVTEFLERWKG